jgi:hypothetical protein
MAPGETPAAVISHTSAMRYRHALSWILAAAASACSGESGSTAPAPSPTPPAPTVLLRDVVISSLPSPFYRFEYDSAGRIKAASYASGLRVYDVTYDGARIAETRDVAANRDRLQYVYDDAGRVGAILYLDASGAVYTRIFFSYAGQLLTGIARERRVDGGFIVDKSISLSYDTAGNLLVFTEHRPPIEGRQDETTTVDRYEAYDDRINVDGFGLIHTEFFDHLLLLPGVQLQKGNPARVTRTGDGINFTVDYTYTYDDSNRPLTKSGDITLTNGPDAGRKIPTRSEFSYY